MNKRLLILVAILLGFGFNVDAQRQNRIGYIDMNYILKNVPDYQEALQELDQKVQKWKGEIDLKKKKIKDLKQDLENERPLLTKDLIQDRQDEIDFQQKNLQDYQQQRFGPQGDMIAQRRQLIQPVQDEVFNAVQEIGKKREYDFIFDNSADALMLFSATRHDISDEVLAYITRSSKKIQRKKDTEKRKETVEKGEPIYKSVEKARKDKEEKESREAEIQEKKDERKAAMDKLQKERDSIQQARKDEMTKRREAVQKDREQRRDSLERERKRIRQKRKRQRDSIEQARKKEMENRGKQKDND